MNRHCFRQIPWDLPAIGRFRRGAVIPVAVPDTDFVFHLHHDHGMRFAVRLLQVPHQCREGGAVQIDRFRAEGGNGVHRFSVPALKQEVLPMIPLHPLRHIIGCAVFPQTEPEEPQPDSLFPGLSDDAVHQREIILSLFRLHELPVDR